MARANNPPPAPVAVVRFDPKAAYANIEAAIREKEDAIVATLVPTIPRERFLSVALQAVTRSPRLLECTPSSIVKALRDAAELGLEPSGLMGSAYLVPYRNKVKRPHPDNPAVTIETYQYEAQLIPGYRGLIDLARRSGELVTMEAHVVRERDYFDFEYGTAQHLIHRPWFNRTGEHEQVVDENTGEVVPGRLLDAGPYVAFYAFARLSSGEFQFDVMTVPEVDAIRRRSKAADDGPWVTDYVAMGRKTVARQLVKFLPLSVRDLSRALELEDAAEGQADAPSAPTAASIARKQLQAALTGRDTASPDVSDAPNGDAHDAPNDGEDAPPTASDDAAPEPEGDPATCGNVAGGGIMEGATCTLPTGHPGAHKAGDMGSWPW